MFFIPGSRIVPVASAKVGYQIRYQNKSGIRNFQATFKHSIILSAIDLAANSNQRSFDVIGIRVTCRELLSLLFLSMTSSIACCLARRSFAKVLASCLLNILTFFPAS
jgi:hypothetical protein